MVTDQTLYPQNKPPYLNLTVKYERVFVSILEKNDHVIEVLDCRPPYLQYAHVVSKAGNLCWCPTQSDCCPKTLSQPGGCRCSDTTEQ